MGRQLIVMDDNSFLNGLFQSLTSSYCLKKLKPSGWKYMYPVVANFPSLPVNHIWMRWIFWFPLTTDDKLIGRRSDFIELNACFRWMKLKPIFWKTIRARGGHFHACRYKWSEQDLRFRLLPPSCQPPPPAHFSRPKVREDQLCQSLSRRHWFCPAVSSPRLPAVPCKLSTALFFTDLSDTFSCRSAK